MVIQLSRILLTLTLVIDHGYAQSQRWVFKGHENRKLSNTRLQAASFKAPTPEQILLEGDFGGIKPIQYDLILKVPVVSDSRKNGGLRFEGSVGISITAADPVQIIMLHAKEINILIDLIQVIDKIHQNPIPIQDIYVDEQQSLLIIKTEKYLLRNGEYLVNIPKFSGKINPGFSVGLYSSFVHQTQTSHDSIIATQFQLDNARTVFPCIDVPHFKTNLSLTVRHPPHYKALSNMPAIKDTVLSDGWIDTRFETSPPLPTYTMAFVVMPNIYRPLEQRSRMGTRVTLHYNKHKMNVAFAEQLLNYALYALNWYETNFHLRLPLHKIDLVTLPEFVVQGMENFGLITLNEEYLKRVKEPEQLSLVAHELAHQWFSNLVTVKGWDHICFQEGITDHYARKLVKQYFSQNQQWQRYIADKYAVAMLDETREVPPASSVVPSSPKLSQVSARCFGKNVFMMDTLEQLVGSREFQTRINRFLEENKYGHVRLEDFSIQFQDLFVESYRMSHFIEDWFKNAGYPSVFVYRNYADNSVVIRQEQVYPKARGYERTLQTWPLSMTGKVERGGSWNLPIKLLSHQEYRINSVPMQWNKWILLNDNFTGFYRVNYDVHNWNLLAGALLKSPEQFESITRSQLISDFCYFNKLGLLKNSASVQKRMFEAVRARSDLFRAYQPLMNQCSPQTNNFRRKRRRFW